MKPVIPQNFCLATESNNEARSRLALAMDIFAKRLERRDISFSGEIIVLVNNDKDSVATVEAGKFGSLSILRPNPESDFSCEDPVIVSTSNYQGLFIETVQSFAFKSIKKIICSHTNEGFCLIVSGNAYKNGARSAYNQDTASDSAEIKKIDLVLEMRAHDQEVAIWRKLI